MQTERTHRDEGHGSLATDSQVCTTQKFISSDLSSKPNSPDQFPSRSDRVLTIKAMTSPFHTRQIVWNGFDHKIIIDDLLLTFRSLYAILYRRYVPQFYGLRS